MKYDKIDGLDKKISKLIPYYYRRTAVFKEKEKEIKEYVSCCERGML